MPSRGEDDRHWKAEQAHEVFYNESKKSSASAAERAKYVLAGRLIREASRRKQGLPFSLKSFPREELEEAAAIVRLEAPGAASIGRKQRYGEYVALALDNLQDVIHSWSATTLTKERLSSATQVVFGK